MVGNNERGVKWLNIKKCPANFISRWANAKKAGRLAIKHTANIAASMNPERRKGASIERNNITNVREAIMKSETGDL